MTYLADIPRIPPEGRSAAAFRTMQDTRRARIRSECIASIACGVVIGAVLTLTAAVAIAPEAVANALGLL